MGSRVAADVPAPSLKLDTYEYHQGMDLEFLLKNRDEWPIPCVSSVDISTAVRDETARQ